MKRKLLASLCSVVFLVSLSSCAGGQEVLSSTSSSSISVQGQPESPAESTVVYEFIDYTTTKEYSLAEPW